MKTVKIGSPAWREWLKQLCDITDMETACVARGEYKTLFYLTSVFLSVYNQVRVVA